MIQQQQVQSFFDDLSTKYREKYLPKNTFHHYFFRKRLEFAIEGIDFSEAKILDIGAGTGELYDAILKAYPTAQFYANDISEEMLAKSNIPENQRFIGNCYALNYPVQKFDYIFILGVTTYMSPEELEKTLAFIYEHLSENGQVIVSFTNRKSLDSKMRKIAKPVLKLLPFRWVVTQGFKVYSYSLQEVNKNIESKFSIKKVRYLNHTLVPFNRFFPRFSIWVAKHIEAWKNGGFKSLLSSDFLVFLER